MKLAEINRQIKLLAKDFNLKYKSNWFNYTWISKKEEILLQSTNLNIK